MTRKEKLVLMLLLDTHVATVIAALKESNLDAVVAYGVVAFVLAVIFVCLSPNKGAS